MVGTHTPSDVAAMADEIAIWDGPTSEHPRDPMSLGARSAMEELAVLPLRVAAVR